MPDTARQLVIAPAEAQRRAPTREPHVLTDQGGVNTRILAREAKVDFRRIEAASLKLPTRFNSAEGKRLFVRLFNTLQLNAHFVSVIARTKLDAAEIQRTEAALRTRLDAATVVLNGAIDGAEAQCKAQGITGLASYDALPLDVDVHVMSSTGRRYLELLVKLDQLMPMLQTLEIHEVLSTEEVDQQRAQIKRQIRDVANHARRQAMLLRRRMNAMDAAAAGNRGGLQDEASSEPAEGSPAGTALDSGPAIDSDDLPAADPRAASPEHYPTMPGFVPSDRSGCADEVLQMLPPAEAGTLADASPTSVQTR